MGNVDGHEWNQSFLTNRNSPQLGFAVEPLGQILKMKEDMEEALTDQVSTVRIWMRGDITEFLPGRLVQEYWDCKFHRDVQEECVAGEQYQALIAALKRPEYKKLYCEIQEK